MREYEQSINNVLDTLETNRNKGLSEIEVNNRRLKYGDFTSSYFGSIKPLKGDSYQALLADSFLNNKLTLVKGRAGSGKTLLSLAFLLH